jgi:hypothetical protein
LLTLFLLFSFPCSLSLSFQFRNPRKRILQGSRSISYYHIPERSVVLIQPISKQFSIFSSSSSNKSNQTQGQQYHQGNFPRVFHRRNIRRKTHLELAQEHAKERKRQLEEQQRKEQLAKERRYRDDDSSYSGSARGRDSGCFQDRNSRFGPPVAPLPVSHSSTQRKKDIYYEREEGEEEEEEESEEDSFSTSDDYDDRHANDKDRRGVGIGGIPLMKESAVRRGPVIPRYDYTDDEDDEDEEDEESKAKRLREEKEKVENAAKEWKPKIGEVPSDITWYICREKATDPLFNIVVDVNRHKPLSRQPYISTFPPQPGTQGPQHTPRERTDNRPVQQSRRDSYIPPSSNNNDADNSRFSRLSDSEHPPAPPPPIFSYSRPLSDSEPTAAVSFSLPVSRLPLPVPPSSPSSRMDPPHFVPALVPSVSTSSAVPTSSSSAPVAVLDYRDVGSYEKRLFEGDEDEDEDSDGGNNCFS